MTTLTNALNDNSPSDPRFKELTHGYYYSFKEKNDRGKFTGGEVRMYIQMDKPLECSYQRTNFQGLRQEKIPHDHGSDWEDKDEDQIPLLYEDRTGKYTGEEILAQAQKWGITLTQIRAIMQNIERRCVEEKWEKGDTGSPLTPEKVTMYDIKRKIIMPFTNKSRKSFVETLPSTKGPQLPRHYLSYTWSAPFKDIVLMLEQFVEDFSRNHNSITDDQGGGMTDETPIHISVFAVNQYAIDRAGGFLPFSEFLSGITQILKLVNYRLITHLDQEGRILERVWPVSDVFIMVKSGGAGSWKIYANHKHEDNDGNEIKVVGLVPGGAPSDKYSIDTVLREKSFPIDLIERFIEYEVKDIKAANNNNDRINFLNTLADEDMDDLDRDPPTEHVQYTMFQDAFRANFATPGTLQAALTRGDKHWKQMLDVMSKSRLPINLQFDFENDKGWDQLDNLKATELIRSLPKTTLRLSIYHASYGVPFVKELSDWIKTAKDLKTLRIEDTITNCGIIDDQHKVIKELAKSLSSINLQHLEIWQSNLQESFMFAKVVRTLIQNYKIAIAFFESFMKLYAADFPDYKKITFLQTVFMSTSSVNLLSKQIKYETLSWVLSLNEVDKAILFRSESGNFSKSILNQTFTDRSILFVIMLDLYIQLIIVILLSSYDDNKAEEWDKNRRFLYLICLVWSCLREIIQIGTTRIQVYMQEASNLFDLAQIVLLISTIDHSGLNMNLLVYTIAVSYPCLIFDLSNVWFPLSTFVNALVEITKELFAFIFTTILISIMFAHMFRVQYFSKECTNNNVLNINSDDKWNDGWKSCSISHSYWKVVNMIVIHDGWSLNDGPGQIVGFLFAFVIGLLLLNIVIAVVSNKFSEVQADADWVFWSHRTSLLEEINNFVTFFKISNTTTQPPNSAEQPPNSAEHPKVGLSDLILRSLLAKRITRRGNRHRKKRFSFNVIPSDDGYADREDVKLFFAWWFSPVGWGHAPNLFVRILMFYLYSNWEDIVFPGGVFERILLSCKYNENLKKERAVIYFAKASMLKVLAWMVLFIHLLFILSSLIVGLATCGLLLPRSLIKWLFHREAVIKAKKIGIAEQITKDDTKEIVTKVDALTTLVNDKEEENNHVPKANDLEELSAKVDALTTIIGNLEEENNSVPKANDLEELNAKVDALTTIIGNLEKLIQNITPTTTP